jgi:integrase
MSDELKPSLADLAKYALSPSGDLVDRPNKKQGGYGQVKLKVEQEFEEVFKRPMELDDINPDVCAMLLQRLKRIGATQNTIYCRHRWFADQAKVAELLGWLPKQDFQAALPARQVAWKSRKEQPTPEVSSVEGLANSDIRFETLNDFFDKRYQPVRLIGKSPNTTRLYKCTIRSFSKWLGRPAIVADLNNQTVSEFLTWMLANTELSSATVAKDQAQLTVLWTFAAKHRWLGEFSDLQVIKSPERVPDAWSDAELRALMRACETAPGMVGNVEACKFWPALVSVIYDTGERIGAVMEIRRDDIDREGWLTVRGEHRKGRTRDKRFKLRPKTLERIQAIKVFGQAKVFEWPFNPGYIFRKFGNILTRAGLPNNRRTKLHKLRRTTASNFEAAGGNATALLDHANRRTTQRYLDPRVVKQVQPADLLPGIGETLTKPVNHDDDDPRVTEFRAFLKSQEDRKPA